MVNIAHGYRDSDGKWHADNPEDYPPMDIHGQLPWSVLDQSAGHWRARVKWWRNQGVDDITPRLHAPAMINTGRHGRNSQGVSRFDPFLTELLVTWLSAPGDLVYDPCAGGPVRGIVTTHLGREYTGCDINHDQIEANRAVASRWGLTPEWLHMDGRDQAVEPQTQDFVLTCPPYHNRERYNVGDGDLSMMRWEEFTKAHQDMVRAATYTLKPNRFLAWVISDVRDSKGHLRGLPELATTHIKLAGLHITNQLILAEPGGLRVKTMRVPWTAARTTTRRHQHIIIAVKGDRKAATKRITNAH
ncbi:class I SAM-dependent methyltransferase [Corynebacterium liangguodongii]|uniref:DNA methyltransferase n=1 Tax=Corynebacterium liangguodongii TaxID=2079535 RepID=A0A2S0WG97_9CORY|nr:class I SAM-dependent methyltransferase [Corynebacterium liangguodongii]AWB84793.1 DNA methyltransferase [Corynebacterium liangguodongii]PWB99151.1 class I SAM-dependent methyltransferase [Corynebacterium liangguodongii]